MTLSVQRRDRLTAVVGVCMLAWCLGARCAQHALVAGVWDYEAPGLGLQAPWNDLVLMGDLLATEPHETGSLTLLENPTKAELVSAFEEAAATVQEDDTFLFYFTGHGARIIDKFGPDQGDEARGKYPDLDDEALLPADADLARPETYLLDDELGDLISAMRTRRVTCIIDTCYSGDILKAPRLGPPKGATLASAVRRPGASRPQDILDDATDFALLIAAAPHNEVVHELRIPVAGRQLPVSALTYSIYRHAGRMAGTTYRQLTHAAQADHDEWALPWSPVLEGPTRRLDEPTGWRPPALTAADPMSLYAVGGERFETTRHRVAALGGVDVALGRLRSHGVRRSAIVIGVDEYGPEFGALRYAGQDAKAMKEVLQDAGFMVTLMTPDSLLQPTRQNIIDQLRWHARMDDLDMLTLYFSGHGEDIEGRGYFVPMDATEPLGSSALGVEALFDILGESNAKRRFVLVDACRVAPKQAFVSALAEQGGETDIVFTACDEGQWAPEVPELGHGLFTHFLLTGLRDDGAGGRPAAAPDGDVTVLGLLDYVMRGIDDWYGSVPPEQRPKQQVTPRVLYNGRYISLLSNEGDDTPLVARPVTPGAPVVPDHRDPQPTDVPFMFSVAPGLSLPVPSDGDVSARFSVNVFAGYLREVRGLEIGYGLNRVRDDVRGAQLSALANAVGGRLVGVQAAGAVNAVGGQLEGVQAAGAVNLLGKGQHRGAQMAGAVNVGAGSLRGFQAAGAVNALGGRLEGVQTAGAVNLLGAGQHRGVQIAGAVNVGAGSLRGFQLSGAVNVAEAVDGGQVGVVNVAADNRGMQVGVVNVAGMMTGLQLGLVNVADEFNGVPVGFLNYSRNGRWDIELSGDEAFPTMVGLRTGTETFHAILGVAAHPDSEPNRWATIAGYGVEVPVGRVSLGVDGLHYKINEDEWWTDELHILNKLRVTVNLRLHDQFSLFAGVTGNVLVSRLNDGAHLDMTSEALYDTKHDDTWVRIWPGIVAGMTF